jgi:FKBP-type peptidyl-prolyl cis-trans isomerase (trigger factor)
MKTNSKKQSVLTDKTFVIDITVKKEDILKEYKDALISIQKDFETKGFRKGKTPLDVVEQQVSKEKVVEDVASKLISREYSKKVEELKLRPIIQPIVNFKNPPADFDKDWEIELTGCELPELELNEKYLDEIKKINTEKFEDENKKIDKLIETLVKYSKVNLPNILVESDIQHHLTHLVDQATQVGLTVDQYLKGKNQDLKTYKESLKSQIEKEWTINLAISKVAQDQKIEVTQKEVEDIVSKNPAMASNINFIYYLLTQQKVFDFLKKI